MTSGKSDLIDLLLVWRRETERAIAVTETEDGREWVWLPKSMVEYERDEEKGLVAVTLPERLALEKELI